MAYRAYTIDSTYNDISAEQLSELNKKIAGQVITPDDTQYDDVRKIWNAMIDKKPAFIIQCQSEDDVIEAVTFARRNDLVMAVRGAGHNIAGRAIEDDVVLVDLCLMRNVEVDPERQQVSVSPGATLGDIDRATQAHGLALPVGINSTTGIAGLTLGGGFGWLSRQYGMTIDNLLSAHVVSADGSLIICDEVANPDLFWAIRGGGGNYGIVTKFTFHLHPVGPEVMAGPLIFALADAQSVLKQYRDFCAKAPEELSVWAVMRHAPPFPFLATEYHGQPVLILACLYSGEIAKSISWIDELRGFATPIGDAVGPHQFVDFQAAFDPLLAPGARNYWKTHNFTAIHDDLVDLLINHAQSLPGINSEIFLAQMGGATNRIPADKTAYPHRDVEFIMNVHTRWEDAADDKTCIDWARRLYQATAPYATGGAYVNFISAGDDSISSAYGANADKLAAIKAKYDPDNRLRLNLNIMP